MRTRLGTYLVHLETVAKKSAGGEIVAGMAVVSGCDTAPVFESAEEPFDDIPASVCAAIERVGRSA